MKCIAMGDSEQAFFFLTERENIGQQWSFVKASVVVVQKFG